MEKKCLEIVEQFVLKTQLNIGNKSTKKIQI